MACRDAYKRKINYKKFEPNSTQENTPASTQTVTRLLFGVDSQNQADNILQNNLTQFEWVKRNKIYPAFWGRNIVGKNALTKEEIKFLQYKCCQIAPIYYNSNRKESAEQGVSDAKEVISIALKLEIPMDVAIYLVIDAKEKITRKYMYSFAKTLIAEGYTPGFKANTDAQYDFDREFSRGVQANAKIFKKCLVWAVEPTLADYEKMTTTHLIHPDEWKPFAPSGITRKEIAIWQYGKDCHPIEDDYGNQTTFHLNLVRNEQIITEKMF